MFLRVLGSGRAVSVAGRFDCGGWAVKCLPSRRVHRLRLPDCRGEV